MIRPYALAPVLALALLGTGLAACGKGSSASDKESPAIGVKPGGDFARRAATLGFPLVATKNTTRVPGADGVADAAAVARAVYTGRSIVTRPRAIALVDKADWRVALAAAVLMSPPLGAPVLFADGSRLPDDTAAALAALGPRGAPQAAGAQVVRVATPVGVPAKFKTTDVRGSNPFAAARAVDQFQAELTGRASDRVMIVSADAPGFAMPAAGWAAKSGDPILFVQRGSLPAATRTALLAHQQPRIYVLGPTSVIGDGVAAQLRKLGTVTRIAGADPVANAIAFARFADGPFGWNIVQPGHGLVFANASRPLDAAAAAPLSASGTYGPLLLVPKSGSLPAALESFLLDIQPGYASDPVRGVYNRGWLIGDAAALSADTQARIDALLEIVPVNEGAATTSP